MGTKKSEYILDICRQHLWQVKTGREIGSQGWALHLCFGQQEAGDAIHRDWKCKTTVGTAATKLSYGHKMPVHAETSVRKLWEQADLGVISTEELVRAMKMHDIFQED